MEIVEAEIYEAHHQYEDECINYVLNTPIALDRLVSNLDMSELITFDNAHGTAYSLVHTNPEAALALYEELKFWKDEGKI